MRDISELYERIHERNYFYLDIFYKIIRSIKNMYILLTGHSLY